MYDVEKLVSIVCDYLDAEADYMKYSLDARKELGLAPDSTICVIDYEKFKRGLGV